MGTIRPGDPRRWYRSHARVCSSFGHLRCYLTESLQGRPVKSPNWNREQLIRVLALYCQIPFGRMHFRNPDVKALAAELGRTPSAVAIKLTNLASLDPELKKRGIRGMSNASNADKEVWKEFYGNWEALADHAIPVRDNELVAAAEMELKIRLRPEGPTELLSLVKARRGQDFFRGMILAAHNSTCCITDISQPQLLRASHIVPWAADPSLRLDPHNGLCLNALHDAAFDCGYVTLSDDLRLLVSPKLKQSVPKLTYVEMFEQHEGKRVRAPERFAPTADILSYHRERVFKG